MKAVLYAHDMEPITILSLEPWTVEYLARHGQVRLIVCDPREFRMPMPEDEANATIQTWTVRITVDTLIRGRQRTMMLFTEDEEAALLLKSAFLPGQTRALREKQAVAFAQGFVHALGHLR